MSKDFVATFGSSIEERIKTDLHGTLTNEFSDVAEIKNLQGANTGYVRVYTADKLIKACCLSIDVMPGARYFNIHIHPEARYLIPRFGFEGMVSTRGSQVSMDFYTDMDQMMHVRELTEMCANVSSIWDEAKASELDIQPSRFAHMRALASPYFLNSINTTEAQLPQVEAIANRYFDEWLKIYSAPRELNDAEAADRWSRREHFANTVIELDPDRDMIVQVFGEDTTQAIERCVML